MFEPNSKMILENADTDGEWNVEVIRKWNTVYGSECVLFRDTNTFKMLVCEIRNVNGIEMLYCFNFHSWMMF